MASGNNTLSRQNSVVSRATTHECNSGPSEQRSVGDTIIWIYVVAASVSGFVLAFSHFLAGEGTGSGLYLSAYHIFLYGVSLLFLLYVQLALLCRRHSGVDSLPDDDGIPDISVAEDGSAVISLNSPSVNSPIKERDIPLETPSDEGDSPNGDLDRKSEGLPPYTASKIDRIAERIYSHSGSGLNLFLRLGLIVFSMGAVILDAFRLLQFVESESAWHCYGHHFLIHTALRLAFFFVQTSFIFKNHKLVLNFQRGFMKWGLLHVVATNASIWSSIFVLETAESYAHLQPLPQAVIYDGEGVAPAVFNVTRICHDYRSLADHASPFLYPCVIQACVVGCVGMYRIFRNVNRDISARHPGGWQPVRQTGVCHKANTGLFSGLFLIVAAVISACFCLLHHNDASPLTRHVTILIYASCHIFILGAALLAVLIGFCRMRGLSLGRNRGVFNEGLLLFALIGHYALLSFTAIPTIANVVDYHTQTILEINQLLFSCLNLTIIGLSLIQSTIQVALVVYGLRMRTCDKRQIKSKPGKSTLTFLMLANIALWLVSTFEVQEIHSELVFRDFYGELPWQLIVHACLPLTNLFRFQSAVCLSSVWFNAYRMDQLATGKDTKEIHESQNLL